jgi:hypothetical protein
MRIGLVVDGRSEFEALGRLKPRLDASTGHTLIGPVRANIHPKAHVSGIAAAAIEAIVVLRVRHVERVVVLLDREDRQECCGALADRIAQEIRSKVSEPVDVVLNDRKFENWLVADVQAVQALPARFRLSRTIVNSITPNKADNVDADSVLRNAAVGQAYQTVKDSLRIFEHADLDRIAANSRSFRRFLRVIDYPDYRDQSRQPR